MAGDRRLEESTDPANSSKKTLITKPTASARARHENRRSTSQKLIDQSLGAALRQLRQTRGVNQTELGRALGVSLQQIQKYEAGSNRLAASTVFRAAEFLGVETGALYAGAGAASAGKRRPTRASKDIFLIIPATKGPGPRGAREAELIDVIRSYQAIETSSERALVRKLLKRLAGGPAKRTPT